MLTVNATTTNTGTLEATNGGTLQVEGTVTNPGHISAGSDSSVLLNGSTIIGGYLTSASNSAVHGEGAFLQGVTITSGSTFSVDAGKNSYLTGDLVNQGTVSIGSSTGGGIPRRRRCHGQPLRQRQSQPQQRLVRSIAGSGGMYNLVNKNNTIEGQGSISNLSSFTNGGTVNANVSGGTLTINSAPTTNTGTLEASAGATLSLVHTTLTNFASTGATAGTLSGGTYEVNSGTLSFNNGGYTKDIVTNAATILLDGTSGTPKFLDQNGNNALANLATNAATGNFTIQNGEHLTTSATIFNNAGNMTIGANSSFTLSGAATVFNTTAGVTDLVGPNSFLYADRVNISGPNSLLKGEGKVVGDVYQNGKLLSGDAPGTLTIQGNYTLEAGGTLLVEIGGAAGNSLLDRYRDGHDQCRQHPRRQPVWYADHHRRRAIHVLDRGQLRRERRRVHRHHVPGRQRDVRPPIQFGRFRHHGDPGGLGSRARLADPVRRRHRRHGRLRRAPSLKGIQVVNIPSDPESG